MINKSYITYIIVIIVGICFMSGCGILESSADSGAEVCAYTGCAGKAYREHLCAEHYMMLVSAQNGSASENNNTVESTLNVSVTNTPTVKPTATNTPTPKPTATNTPTPRPTATNTPTPKPTATNTPTPVPEYWQQIDAKIKIPINGDKNNYVTLIFTNKGKDTVLLPSLLWANGKGCNASFSWTKEGGNISSLDATYALEPGYKITVDYYRSSHILQLFDDKYYDMYLDSNSLAHFKIVDQAGKWWYWIEVDSKGNVGLYEY